MNIKRLKALLFSVLMISCIALFLSSCGDSTDEYGILTYEEYIALSAEEQSLYFDSFSTPEEFINWYNDAKTKYDALHKPSDDENSEEIEGSIGLGGAVPGEGTEEDSEDDSDKTNEDNSDKTDEDDLPTTDDGKNNEGGENPDDSSEEDSDKTDDPSQNENNDADAPTTDDDSTTDSDDSATDGEGTSEGSKYEGMLTWSEYIALSEEEQMAFFRSFEDPMEFFEWQEYATKKYEEENKGLDPGDGNIDLGGN